MEWNVLTFQNIKTGHKHPVVSIGCGNTRQRQHSTPREIGGLKFLFRDLLREKLFSIF